MQACTYVMLIPSPYHQIALTCMHDSLFTFGRAEGLHIIFRCINVKPLSGAMHLHLAALHKVTRTTSLSSIIRASCRGLPGTRCNKACAHDPETSGDARLKNLTDGWSNPRENIMGNKREREINFTHTPTSSRKG